MRYLNNYLGLLVIIKISDFTGFKQVIIGHFADSKNP